jgi:hypothetical protein
MLNIDGRSPAAHRPAKSIPAVGFACTRRQLAVQEFRRSQRHRFTDPLGGCKSCEERPAYSVGSGCKELDSDPNPNIWKAVRND